MLDTFLVYLVLPLRYGEISNLAIVTGLVGVGVCVCLCVHVHVQVHSYVHGMWCSGKAPPFLCRIMPWIRPSLSEKTAEYCVFGLPPRVGYT